MYIYLILEPPTTFVKYTENKWALRDLREITVLSDL
jgi:hypothetical protein